MMLPVKADERWSMDFTSDQLFDGRRFRTLNIVEDFTRESLAIEVDVSPLGMRVARVLEELVRLRCASRSIGIDNGPKFTSKALDAWAYENRINLSFIEPGKPA